MDYAVADADLAPAVADVNRLLAALGQAPYDPDDLRGEMNQLKALVDLCHLHGLAVLFDVVYNHAGGDFGDESLYFFDRQPVADGHRRSLYFTDVGHAGGLVFDFAKPEVRDFLIQNARFFLDEYRIDGFRYDQVSVIDHDGAPEGWRFCQDLTRTLQAHRSSALQKAEYWNVNPYVVRPVPDGAGFDVTLTDGLRLAVREVIAYASHPDERPLPMTRLAESLEDKPWSDNLDAHGDLLLHWAGLDAGDRDMVDHLRFMRELIHLRWREPALRGQGFRVVHVHDANRVLAFHRWVEGEGRDVLVVAHLGTVTRGGYRVGFPGGGAWREVFNSDVYEQWVNPNVAGNGGRVEAAPEPLHGFAHSAPLVLPAASLLVFAR